jgi:hypothetical protein
MLASRFNPIDTLQTESNQFLTRFDGYVSTIQDQIERQDQEYQKSKLIIKGIDF